MALAPDLTVSRWFNTNRDLSLSDFRGKIVVLEAFQILCPGCIFHGIPLAQTVERTFPSEKVAVVGLHSVFEHHAAMTPVSLQAFLYEFRVTFPVAVDMPGKNDIPITMAAYGMRGTPSLLLIDQNGILSAHHYGQVSEMQLGAEIAKLLS